jgi:hypothetical protein
MTSFRTAEDFDAKCVAPYREGTDGDIENSEKRKKKKKKSTFSSDQDVLECPVHRRVAFVPNFSAFILQVACAVNAVDLSSDFGSPLDFLARSEAIKSSVVPANGLALEFGVWYGSSLRLSGAIKLLHSTGGYQGVNNTLITGNRQ